ncbi:hypothetical protein CSPAE12_00943 [Colletotrichum incanum]|nr:hypothetical protein CSPAE12_00943 [Colletotrichum incanum]
MASIRTIASLALALGVAAIPAPAPAPAPEPEPEAAPAVVDTFSPFKLKGDPFTLSVLPLSSVPVQVPGGSLALPSVDIKLEQALPTTKLLPRVTTAPSLQFPKISPLSIKLDGLSVSLTLPELSIPTVAVPSLPPIGTPALPSLPAVLPTSPDLLPGNPSALSTLIPRPSIVRPEKPTTLLTLVPAPSGLLTCATVLCKRGYVCQEKQGRPSCVPSNACGNIFCPFGTSCCNASCNVCTPPGVMCTQQVCGPLPALKASGIPETPSVPVVDAIPQ